MAHPLTGTPSLRTLRRRRRRRKLCQSWRSLLVPVSGPGCSDASQRETERVAQLTLTEGWTTTPMRWRHQSHLGATLTSCSGRTRENRSRLASGTDMDGTSWSCRASQDLENLQNTFAELTARTPAAQVLAQHLRYSPFGIVHAVIDISKSEHLFG